MALDLVEKVGNTIYLEEAPVIDTIQVKYGPVIIPQDPLVGWMYDPYENAIRISRNVDLSQAPEDSKLTYSFVRGEFEQPGAPK